MPTHGHTPDWQPVGHLTVCVGKNADGGLIINFYDETLDPIGLTVAFIELVLNWVPQEPRLLFHIAHACSSREHVAEVIKQLSPEARAMLQAYLEENQLGGDRK